MSENVVDYVVVGAGTAGCIMAARLSVDPNIRVALLELGGNDSNPAIYDKNLNSMYSLWDPRAAENWGYSTMPQSTLGGRSVDIARGKVLGGCSAVNAMIYIRGNRRDFNAWSQFGNRGWSYEETLPYFKKSETYHGPVSPYHGESGPISVIEYLKPSEAGHAFVEAAATLGAGQKYNDFNGAIQEAGAGFYQSTRTVDGVRVTAMSAFVRPVLGRNNLQILTQVRATRLILEKGRVCGVEYSGRDGLKTIRAEREVALCGGTFETPKLLMLSGLGPAEQLSSHGIGVVQNLPGVGRNLQDHLLLGVAYESLIPLDPPELLAEAGLFTWTPGGIAAKGSPDLQYFFGPVQFVAQEYRTNGPGFTFAPILSQPFSRGTVTLASGDPAALARVDPQYLSREEDFAALEYGIRYARELAHTNAFNKLRGRELAPGEAVTGSSELRDYIRKVCGTVWHPVGTCRMGMGADAVVDDELRVHGVDGLRIADASVIPKLVNGNPNAAIMMIAEKAADLIRYSQTPAKPRCAPTDISTGERPGIHQFIFAYPRPGMTEAEFQRYWVEVHAVKFASKIPQIRKYLVDTCIPIPGENGAELWDGVAEIWLANEKEQIESLQSKEFLQGARIDEPTWAAFWCTVVLDTTAHVILPGPAESRDSSLVKLLILAKRKEGLPLEVFRSKWLGAHAQKALELPGLRRYIQGHVRDNFYAVGEAVLDCVEQLWFDSVDAVLAAQRSVQQDIVNRDYHLFSVERYVHKLLVREHWIIGPEPRPYTEP